MFRIRRVYDDTTPTNRELLTQVQAILRTQFPGLRQPDIDKLPDQLLNPLKHRFRCILHVAERRSSVCGFALMLHAPDLKFCYLDYISAAGGETGRGIGGALYTRVREEASNLDVIGIFLECLPDDEALCPDPVVLRQNAARLKFYERFGALPIIGTGYETPIGDDADNPPYLVFDSLGVTQPLERDNARTIVRAILERKYADQCPPEYVKRVVASFADAQVSFRAPRYTRKISKADPTAHHRQIALIVNEAHSIHHVRERGYVESPVRIGSILKELDKTGLFEKVAARHHHVRYISAVHDPKLISFLKRTCEYIGDGKSVYPYVFPIRNDARPPKEMPLRAGYFCIDTFTPLNGNAYKAALGAVDCAMTGCQMVLDGWHAAYALVRPPGHHAERRVFGGFCYFNSAAIAAQEMSRFGKVALLDIDYHHGNGAQDIFWERPDIYTISIHGHPRLTYPYFSGFDDEKGAGEGEGFNHNYPMPEKIDGEKYLEVLTKALKKVKRFKPRFLVIALGLDTARGDPTGSWTLNAADFAANGKMIGELGLPTLIVQEGGYKTGTLGVNARHFFTGFAAGAGLDLKDRKIDSTKS